MRESQASRNGEWKSQGLGKNFAKRQLTRFDNVTGFRCFLEILHPCALDESGLSIGRVVGNILLLLWPQMPWNGLRLVGY